MWFQLLRASLRRQDKEEARKNYQVTDSRLKHVLFSDHLHAAGDGGGG